MRSGRRSATLAGESLQAVGIYRAWASVRAGTIATISVTASHGRPDPGKKSAGRLHRQRTAAATRTACTVWRCCRSKSILEFGFQAWAMRSGRGRPAGAALRAPLPPLPRRGVAHQDGSRHLVARPYRLQGLDRPSPRDGGDRTRWHPRDVVEKRKCLLRNDENKTTRTPAGRHRPTARGCTGSGATAMPPAAGQLMGSGAIPTRSGRRRRHRERRRRGRGVS